MRGRFREVLHIPVIAGERVVPRLRKGLRTIQRYDGKPIKVVMSEEEEVDILNGLETMIDLSKLREKTIYGIPFDVIRDERESNP